MSLYILVSKIPRWLEKYLKQVKCDRIGDLKQHVEHVDNKLDYYHAHMAIECKLFALTLLRVVMMWNKTLLDRSIDSWKDLYDSFVAWFITQKQQPTTMVVLSGIMQGKKTSYVSTLTISI